MGTTFAVSAPQHALLTKSSPRGNLQVHRIVSVKRIQPRVCRLYAEPASSDDCCSSGGNGIGPNSYTAQIYNFIKSIDMYHPTIVSALLILSLL